MQAPRRMLLDDEQQRPVRAAGVRAGGSGVRVKVRLAA